MPIFQNQKVSAKLSDVLKTVKGFPVGEMIGNDIQINNHINFVLKYHVATTGLRVVGAEVIPQSVSHEIDNGNVKTCQDNSKIISSALEADFIPISKGIKSKKIAFTYSVTWEEDPKVEWGSRFDIYLTNRVESKNEWKTLVDSFLVALLLTFLVGFIFIRTVYRDISRYNNYLPINESREDELEESGWKLLHGDVFRPPFKNPMLFSVIVGTGVQLLLMLILLLITCSVGLITTSSRGSLLTLALFGFVILSSVSGYFSSRIYKYCKGYHWKSLTFFTGTFFPSIVVLNGMIINLFSWWTQSSRALPFLSIIYLLLLWLGVSLPLVFLGAYLGFKQEVYEVPCKVSSVARMIAPQPWFNSILFTVLLAGALPFATISMELKAIISSMWLHQVFAVFSSLLAVFFVTAFTIAELSIVFCYYQLIYENHLWWWRSVFTGGSIGIYVFMYSIYYGYQLEITQISSCIY